MGDLVYKISRSRTRHFSVNGYPSYLPKRISDKHSSRESILAQKLYPRFFGNRETLIFGLVLWTQRSIFFPYGSFSIKDGSKIRFWENKWLGNTIVRHKRDTIAKVMEISPPNVAFRRSLIGPRQTYW
jgi:hypothetical protein